MFGYNMTHRYILFCLCVHGIIGATINNQNQIEELSSDNDNNEMYSVELRINRDGQIVTNNTITEGNGPKKNSTAEKETVVKARRYPCTCAEGECSCCTGFLLDQFKQKGCMKIKYDPDEFAFDMKLLFNERVMYKTKLSGKNPPPVCIRVPRLRVLKLCVKFSNLYFAGRNLHTCVDMDANWEDYQLFHMSFDCIRIGANGVAVVAPEEGGGVAVKPGEDEDSIEDYDENV